MPVTGRPKTSKDVTWECAYCGESQVSPDYEAFRRRFCSRKCFHAAGGSGGPGKKEPAKKECPKCGDVFLTGGQGRPAHYQKYCSRGCQNAASGGQPRPRQLTELETAWLAGLFDGEGSIVFAKGRKQRSVTISMHNTCYPLLKRVEEITKTGRVFDHSKYRTSPKHSDVWVWQCYGQNARILLRQMLPWLIVKKDRALKVLADE